MLQFDIWQLALCYFVPKLFTVDYLKCVLLKLLSCMRLELGHNKDRRQRYTILVKNIDCNDGGLAECCLNWNIFEIGVNCEF